MILPLCLILGDSTAIGAADALVSQGVRCEMHARVGASSTQTLRTFRGNVTVDSAIIALGSNDPSNPQLLRNLVTVRQRVSAARVTWLLPYNPVAARAAQAVAQSFGDAVIDLAAIATRDRVHPANYRSVASLLAWARRRSSAGPGHAPRTPVEPPVPPVIRQAVVLRF